MCNKECWFKQTVTIVTIVTRKWYNCRLTKAYFIYLPKTSSRDHASVPAILRWWLEFFHASITNIQNFVMFLSHRGNQGRATMWEKQRFVEWNTFIHPWGSDGSHIFLSSVVWWRQRSPLNADPQSALTTLLVTLHSVMYSGAWSESRS